MKIPGLYNGVPEQVFFAFFRQNRQVGTIYMQADTQAHWSAKQMAV